jgi:hypothetical protein
MWATIVCVAVVVALVVSYRRSRKDACAVCGRPNEGAADICQRCSAW